MDMAGKSKPPTELDLEIIKILQSRAKALNISSLRELESHSGVTRSTVQRVLAGARTLKISELESLCDALGLVLWEVLKEAQDRVHAKTRNGVVVAFPSRTSTGPQALPEMA